MLDSLRAVGVCDELMLAGRPVRVFCAGGRRASRCGLGGRLPLRHAGGYLDIVILLAAAVPLRDPSGGELRWFERGAVVGGGGASHLRGADWPGGVVTRDGGRGCLLGYSLCATGTEASTVLGWR